jgi:MFS family permease
MMSGIVKVGTGFGQLLVPLFAAALIRMYGWRTSYLIMSAVFLVMLLAASLFLRRDPGEMGLLPDGGSDDDRSAGTESSAPDFTLREAVRTRQFRVMCANQFIIFFCMLTVIVHIVPHASDLGLSPATAAGVLSTIGGVSILGRFVTGMANDRIGGKRSLTTCFVVMIGGLICLQAAADLWVLFLFAGIYGLAHGGFFTVVSPTVAELFGVGSHGTLFGIILFFGTIGGAIGPLMAGRIFDMTGSYRTVFLILTVALVLGLVLVTLLRPLRGSGNRR